MKNLVKRLAFIVFVAIIGFSLFGCIINVPDDGGNNNSLSAPSGLSATAISSSEIDLDWNAVSGASGYYVYQSTTSSSSGFTRYSNSVSSNGASVTGLNSNTLYYFRVIAFDSNGRESAQSSTASARTLSSSGGGSRPNTPTGITATTVSGGIRISWSSVSGATEYTVYWSSSANGNYEKVDSTSSTSYTDYDVTSGTTYYYKVSASNSYGESSLSSYASATASGGSTANTSLNGIWDRNDGNVISILGSDGYFTIIDSGWKRVEQNGDIRIGSGKFRSIRNTGNLTWSAQELTYTRDTYRVSNWVNCTITMAANGNTFTSYSANTDPPSMTYTRRDNNQLNGVWEREDGNVITIIDENGYFTVIDSGWKRVEQNGDIRIGSGKFRNIRSTSTVNRTWSAQELTYTRDTYRVSNWVNSTITMSSDGNSFTSYSASTDPQTQTYYRRR